jgi:hypothetical protein
MAKGPHARIVEVSLMVKYGEEVVTVQYDATEGRWISNGPLFARHLKVLTGITALCREADAE